MHSKSPIPGAEVTDVGTVDDLDAAGLMLLESLRLCPQTQNISETKLVFSLAVRIFRGPTRRALSRK